MQIREGMGTLAHEIHDVILSGGEAGARDLTSVAAFDAV